jgi:CBS domain-containing protein
VVAVGATPLMALDALLLDTETTGLDPRIAEIVEIAIIPLVAGQMRASETIRHLVHPSKPIPREATRIHGIDDAAVKDAPTFAEIWPEVSSRIGNRIVIGHSIGYDLAVLREACTRAGLEWRAPRSLDVRLLAEVATPNLPDYALERLAAWLEVECEDRHSARGDALTAGRIFLGLIPRLREHGIRTLAEAERACTELSAARETHHRLGWIEPGADADEAATRGLLRLDSYPYRYRVRDAMSAPAKMIDAVAPLSAAIERMAAERVSSLFVSFAEETQPTSANTGIVSERDAMRRIAASGADALRLPIGTIASRPLLTVSADALIFVAMARMNRLNIRHLGVVGADGTVIGALSARDLLRVRAEGSVELGDEIFTADDVHALARAWGKLPHVAAGLLAEGLAGREIAALVSHQLAALSERAAILAERRMVENGLGAPPCSYVFCILGSGGRGESLLAMDQDNALIYADGGDAAAHDRWFAVWAEHVTSILNDVGVPYCKGGVMATNPRWRGSVREWRERVAAWIRRSDPQDLLAVDIFFDMRGVHGEIRLAEELWREAFDAAKGNATFAKLLTASVGEASRGLTLLGNFRTEQGRIDLKQHGLFGVVSVARALAICHHVVERETPARLAELVARGIAPSDLEALASAQEAFLDLIVAQQLEDVRRGVPPSNKVEVKRLTRKQRERLHVALRSVGHLDALVRDNLFGV